MTSEMAIRRTDQSAAEPLDSRVWRIVAVASFGPLMTQLDSTVVDVSLSSIGRDPHVSIDSVQWIVSGYLLALALTLPLLAWFVHRFGAKRPYV
jgi:MFS family permease